MKNHAKDLSVFYYQPQPEPSQGKIENQPLQKQIEVINQGQKQGITLSGTQKQQQQVNTFDVSELQLKDKGNYVESKQKDNLQKEKSMLMDRQYLSQIPLLKMTTYFSIQTNKLLLPVNVYKKFTKLLIQKYFTLGEPTPDSTPTQKLPQQQQSQQQQKETKKQPNNKLCQFNLDILSCPSSQYIKLEKLTNITIGLVINNITVQFPIRSLIQTCREKQCTFLIGVSKDKKQVVIGDFILNIFAIQYKANNYNFILYRLDNQWAKLFVPLSQRKYAYSEVNFLFMFVWFILKAIFFVFKGIVFVAGVVLVLNCLYHWRQIIEWVANILANISRKGNQNNEISMKSLRKNINKMSVRIKDRLKTAMKKPRIHQLEQEQLIQNVEHKNQTTKLIMRSVDDLPDVQDVIDDYLHKTAGDYNQYQHHDEDEKILLANQATKQALDRTAAQSQTLTNYFQHQGQIAQISSQSQNKTDNNPPTIQQTHQTQQMKNKNQKKIEQQQQFYQFENTQFQGSNFDGYEGF